MGWWTTEDDAMIGDLPLDLLGDAFVELIAAYRRDHGRAPTRREWETLLLVALESLEPEHRIGGADTSLRRIRIE